MKNQVIINLRIARIKHLAIQLRAKYQIPSELSYRISLLDKNSKSSTITYLMEQCKHMLRITNYYKNYRDIEKEYNEIIKKDFEKGV